MKKLLLAGISFAALVAGPATAADLARPAYVAPVAYVPVASWTGFYAGINTGGSIGVSTTTDSGLGTFAAPAGGVPLITANLFGESFRHLPTGWVLGGQAGYNYQIANYVVGFEADWQWTSQKDTATLAGCGVAAGNNFQLQLAGAPLVAQCLTDEQKLTNFGTARAGGRAHPRLALVCDWRSCVGHYQGWPRLL